MWLTLEKLKKTTTKNKNKNTNNRQTRFTETASLCSGPVSALTAGQVNQTQLAHIHLVFVLLFSDIVSASPSIIKNKNIGLSLNKKV